MKICAECHKYDSERVEKFRKAGIKITKCKLEECEMRHPNFRPKLPKELAGKTEERREKTKHIKGSTWGWVYFDHSALKVWYWWLFCDDLSEGTCSLWQPSDEVTCDIHYEPPIYINDLGSWFAGLVNFGGCRPATNCGGDCGQVNSKRNGVCLRRYSEAPEVFVDGWLWCLYDATGIRDCLLRTQYMILDYTP